MANTSVTIRRLVPADAIAYRQLHARNRPRIKLVQLTVTQGNDGAHTLYAHCGFVQFGLEPFAVAVGEEFVAKIHMWCNLERQP